MLSAKGDEETVFRFHVDDIGQVFAVLKPYRRRRLSEAERKRLAEAGRRFRFGPSHGVESDFTPAQSTNTQLKDPGSDAREKHGDSGTEAP